MDGVLDLVAKVVPLLSFYPRWAQSLFLSAFLLAISSFAVFVIGYPAASAKKTAAEASAAEEKLTEDAKRDIDSGLREMESVFADLGLGLSAYYAAAVSLRLDLLDYTTKHPDVGSYVDRPLTPELSRDAQEVIAKLASIRAALAGIQRHRLSANCWERSARSSQGGALGQVRQSLIEHGFTNQEATIDIADLSNLQQFMAMAERHLGQLTFGGPLEAVLATNSADIPGVGKAYDNAALRTLVFAGNLIFAFVTQSKTEAGRGLVASWGSAMLLDLYSSIPDTDVVRAEFADRYKPAAKAVATMSMTFNARRTISSDFEIAAKELRKKTGLLFLELPKKAADDRAAPAQP
jgi:hypothetical protein